MNIITTNPIIDEKDFIEEDYYSNLFGEAARRKRQTRKASRQRKRTARKASGGGFLNRAADTIGNVSRGVQQSGLLDTFGQMGQGGQGDMPPMGGGFDDPMMNMPPMVTPPRQGMSTGAKVAIGVLVAGALGVGIYFLTKRKGKSGK